MDCGVWPWARNEGVLPGHSLLEVGAAVSANTQLFSVLGPLACMAAEGTCMLGAWPCHVGAHFP